MREYRVSGMHPLGWRVSVFNETNEAMCRRILASYLRHSSWRDTDLTDFRLETREVTEWVAADPEPKNDEGCTPGGWAKSPT